MRFTHIMVLDAQSSPMWTFPASRADEGAGASLATRSRPPLQGAELNPNPDLCGRAHLHYPDVSEGLVSPGDLTRVCIRIPSEP